MTPADTPTSRRHKAATQVFKAILHKNRTDRYNGLLACFPRRPVRRSALGGCQQTIRVIANARPSAATRASVAGLEAILHICAALDPHTDGIVNAKKKGSAFKCPHLAGWPDLPSPSWLALPWVLAPRLRLPIPLMTHTSHNCAPSALHGRRTATRPSSRWRTSSVTTTRRV